jgi:AraC-like DNA-binding protein
VARSLQPFFEAVWFHRVPDNASGISAIVPDGCADVVFAGGALRIAGPDRQVKFEAARPGATVVGLRFRPGAALPWLGTPVHHLADKRIGLKEFWGAEADRLAAWIGEASDPVASAQRLETALIGKLPKIANPDGLSGAIFRVVNERCDYSIAVIDQVCRALELSERTLRRRCYEAFGYGPKTLDRILRFQKFLRLARNSPTHKTAELAASAGFADQPHITREALNLSGLTPSQIRSKLADRR